MKRIIYISIYTTLVLVIDGCGKAFLDAKPDSFLVIPNTLEDCQKILDNDFLMTAELPSLDLLGSDEYFVNTETWQASDIIERTAYIWADDIYQGGEYVPDWNSSFQAIFACNAVLQVLESIPINEGNRVQWENIRATALFYRAYRYFALAEVFTLPYDANNSQITLGLPIRMSPDIDYIVQRANLEETFNFILNDFIEAVSLLTNGAPNEKLNRPSLAAVHGALAKVYLVLGEYETAFENAEICLNYYNQLLDYNNVSQLDNYPFEYNPEIIFAAMRIIYNNIHPYPFSNSTFVDNELYASYDYNDLRKTTFYNRLSESAVHRKFLYGYDGRRSQNFVGIATDEIYLIKAECQARAGQGDEAMVTLDELLVKRYKSDTYVNRRAESAREALAIVLEERRKELFFRGARWSDVRRLNVEGANITMWRELNGQVYTLEPGSPKFAFPLPDSEVNLGGLEQNPR